VVQVIIQPSYGNKDAQTHWRDTLDQEVDFRTLDRAEVLTSTQREALARLHPLGRARFWGAPGHHDVRMATLSTGDVVLFTGKNLVQAVGEVGFSFRNAEFADTLWLPHPDRGSYRNVYSLLTFQRTEIPYREIWELDGFTEGDNFMGLRFLDDTKRDVILDGLRIDTLTGSREAVARELALTATLSPAEGRLVGAEAVNVAASSYDRIADTILVHRAEALLVERYRATLSDCWTGRLCTSAGVTDLYVRIGDGVEILEAKREAGHTFVRAALGQLLDYVRGCTDPILRLTALFPVRPALADVQLLHHYGIDCVYERQSGEFERLAPPSAWRFQMAGVWSRRDG
jgi:hypothetical protein